MLMTRVALALVLQPIENPCEEVVDYIDLFWARGTE